MIYFDALRFKLNHRMWTWRQCVHFARQDRARLRGIDPNAVIYGICIVVAAVLIVAPWLTRAGCGA